MKKKNNNKQKKLNYILIMIIIILLLFIIFKAVKFSFNKIMSNIYEISEINKNIDNLQKGDTIKYEANGYSDWEVLYIDKENKTIDIISKTSPEEVTLKGKDGYENGLNIIQEKVNKYLSGDSAISARNVTQADLQNFNYEGVFFTSNLSTDSIYYDSGILNLVYGNKDLKLIPKITINVDDSSALTVGDSYEIEINGISEWYVFSVDSSTSISIIPKEPIKIFKTDSIDCVGLGDIVQSRLDEFKTANVVNVNNVSSNDLNTLNNIDGLKNIDVDYSIFLSNPTYRRNGEYTYYGYSALYDEYSYNAFNYSSYSRSFSFYNTFTCGEYEYTLGIRPIITLKFSNDLVEEKEINTDLKIGDSVKYSSHEYNNWKVLSIDNENKTVDIISGGIVKNIRLSGLDDYNNYETLMQDEVDAYKTGDKVISARLVNISDFENLRNMNDKTIARYYLNNKNEYKTNYRNYYLQETTTYVNIVNYAVAVGYYSELDSEPTSEWEVLYVDSTHASSGLSGAATGPSSYLAGLRPIITLKLDEVEKISADEVVETQSQESYVQEQTKANANYTKSITKKQIESKLQDIQPNDVKEEQAKENEKEEVEVITKKVIKEDPKAKENYTLFKKYNKKVKGIIINLIILDLIVGFIFYILYKRKNKKTVKF